MTLMEVLILAVVVVVTASVGLLVARSTRRITYASRGTDNMKQVYTAASFGQWRWPSHMHRCVDNGIRTRMKDAFILGLVVTQRLLRDRNSDYPLVILCTAANCISAILVFLIASTYWNAGVGLLAWGLVITNLSSYQEALWGTHITLSQTFLLASVYLMQQSEQGLAWYVPAGVAVGLMLFASASSRKYLPLVAGAFVYSQREALWEPSFVLNWGGLVSGGLGLTLISISGALLLGALIVRLTYRRLVTFLFSEQATGRVVRLFSSRRVFELGDNIASADKVSSVVTSFSIGLAVYLILPLPLAHSTSFYWSQLLVVLGALGAVLLLTYPDVLGNLWAYYRYSQGWKYNRFSYYRGYFASTGKPIKDAMRGGGVLWIVRFFSRVTPLHAAFFLISLVLLIPLIIVGENQSTLVWQAVAVIVVSLSPILVGEITHSAQSSRAYFPGSIGLVAQIAYVVYQLDQALPAQWMAAVWLVAGAGVLAAAGWALWMYLDDVLPARMAVARLGQKLRALGVDEFFTFDTCYNDAFVNALPAEDLERYNIHYIDSINQVKEGYIVVPGTSSKAVNVEGARWAIEHGDFDLDRDLDRLIKTKEIEKYAVASFKTFGTSRFWVQEAEVLSYLDLILKEIGDDDRWRGRAWILDAAKLHSAKQYG